jgi:hypothetical protein
MMSDDTNTTPQIDRPALISVAQAKSMELPEMTTLFR